MGGSGGLVPKTSQSYEKPNQWKNLAMVMGNWHPLSVKDPPLNEKRQTAALENPQSFGKLSTTNICNDTQNTPTQLQHSPKECAFPLALRASGPSWKHCMVGNHQGMDEPVLLEWDQPCGGDGDSEDCLGKN